MWAAQIINLRTGVYILFCLSGDKLLSRNLTFFLALANILHLCLQLYMQLLFIQDSDVRAENERVMQGLTDESDAVVIKNLVKVSYTVGK